MLTVYVAERNMLKPAGTVSSGVPSAPLWIDLLHPTMAEVRQVETALSLELPSQEEMQEIEVSSRLYKENDALFMTATLLAKTTTEMPEALPVTFILAVNSLMTIRYSEPRAFQAFLNRAQRHQSDCSSGESVLVSLLDAVTDRSADILERIATDIDAVSAEVFENHVSRQSKSRDFQNILREIGRKGDLNSKARESLVSLGRLLTFLVQNLEAKASRDHRNRLKTLMRDIHALTDHASFLSNKINFLLDATLGMVNIEQNAIIKIFTVAAVAFLPPTLIASIYGMNFRHMPELDWPVGYPIAISLMVLSALLPFLYFKRRGWL